MMKSKAQQWVDEALKTEWSNDFVQHMQDRMVVSYAKYGPLALAYPSKMDALKSLQQRLDKYRDTGNLEFIVDAANFCLIEYLRPSHPKPFFKGTDSDESPGRTTNTGRVTHETNEDQQAKALAEKYRREGD